MIDLLDQMPGPWVHSALCGQTDPALWFPEMGGPVRDAKRICGRCDVRVECLEYALANNEGEGVWGGLSTRERQKLRRGAAA